VESFPPSSDSDRDDSDGGGGGDDPRTSAASLLAASIALDAGVHPRLAAKIAAGTSIRVRALVMNLQSSNQNGPDDKVNQLKPIYDPISS
jgi:hypothetical protein